MTGLAGAWEWLTTTPLLPLTLTLGAYWLGDLLWRRFDRNPLLTPILTSSAVVGVVLVLARIPYDDYLHATSILTFLLGTATVALAVPLYRQAAKVREAAPMVLGTVVGGGTLAVLVGYWLTRLLGGSDLTANSMAPKSVTTPVAMALSGPLGGSAPLTIAFVTIAGIMGAVAGPALLNLARVRDPRARGLAIGVSSHAMGTSRALQDGEETGAFSGLAMGLNALLTAVIIGLLI